MLTKRTPPKPHRQPKKSTPSAEISGTSTGDEVKTQMAYVDQQRRWIWADGGSRPAKFDQQLMAHLPCEVISKAGNLVQIYRSDLDPTFKTERKLLPEFSAPRRVVSREQNSYQLQTLEFGRLANRVQFAPFTVVHSEEGNGAGESAGRDRERVAESGRDRKNQKDLMVK